MRRITIVLCGLLALGCTPLKPGTDTRDSDLPRDPDAGPILRDGGDGGPVVFPDGGMDGGRDGGPHTDLDGGPRDASPDASDFPVRSVRFSYLMSDGAAADVCVKVSGAPDSEFQGPLFAGLGRSAGLRVGQVSTYLSLTTAALTLRLVEARAPDCTTSLVGSVELSIPARAAGDFDTAVILLAPSGDAPRLTMLVDSRSAPPETAAVRFFHGSIATTSFILGRGSNNADFEAIWRETGYGQVALSGMTSDANDFVLLPATTADTDLTLKNAATPGFYHGPVPVPTTEGNIVSLYLFRTSMSVGELLVTICRDTLPSTDGLASCTTTELALTVDESSP